ncbi:hypothetical protein [uncultured Methanobrevibacter sp.]|uniref:hypothetical protein n=1 Tax=uncultured Methanobrevibacter sp. TaxID=253161 RepID=UPI0025FA531E|nr:hypothetical protein [uncultured Methanobrevibacter sp.]
MKFKSESKNENNINDCHFQIEKYLYKPCDIYVGLKSGMIFNIRTVNVKVIT